MFDYKNAEDFKEQNGYTIDKSWYPRVTRIVSIKSKPALHYFYAGLKNYAEGERIKKISAQEGTSIHEAVQAILTNQPPTVTANIQPAIDKFSEYLSHNPIEVLPESIEKRVVNYKHRYAGTIDAIALIDGKMGILDIKTSQAIYRDFALQTSAYMASLRNELPALETRWILRIDQAQVCQHCGAKLRSKGGRTKKIIDWSNPFMRTCKHEWGKVVGEIELQEFPFWENDFSAFLGAKRLWEWENEKWLKAIGYL